MKNPHLRRIQNWILQPGSEGRHLLLSTIVGPEGLDKKRFMRVLGKEPIEGLYAFVWVGPDSLPDDHALKLKGKTTRETHDVHEIHWRTEDFPEECTSGYGVRYPLYIGKTTTIYKRLGQHLHLSMDDWKETAYVHRNGKRQAIPFQEGFLHKHSTTCQFRSGMQHLFPELTRSGFIPQLKNVEFCFLPIPATNEDSGQAVKDRFYLEDLAIGYFRPWFNVDSER